jgi:hypothetical protein
MKKIKIKYAVIISIFICIFFISSKTMAADTSFSCNARIGGGDAFLTVGVQNGNPSDYKIGILQTDKKDPRLANFDSAQDVSGNNLLAQYHLNLLDKETTYKVLIFAKVTGKYAMELPECNFKTPGIINGACGSINGKSSPKKPVLASELCSAGVATPVSEVAGDWTWRCDGQNGGTKKSCSAKVGASVIDASSEGGGLVPDCPASGCGFEELMKLINKVINFLLFTIATPLAALVFAYSGIMLITAGGSSEKMTKAKKILGNLVVGYVIALAAWLIINTILSALGFHGSWFLTK